MRVLITGAGGFLGTHLMRGLSGHSLIAASRHRIEGKEWRQLPDLGGSVDWDPLLRDIDAVVHLANIAHRTASDEDFERVNHRATADLCVAAKRAGLQQLVLVSSIGAQVGHTAPNVVTEADAPLPTSAYGRAKLAAESAVAASGVPYTILRPVLVVGEGAKGNAATLQKLARLPLPLPLGAIKAKRSVLSVENFVSAVATVLGNARAIGEVFVVSDREPLTVGELVADARAAMGRPAHIFSVPEAVFERGLAAIGALGIWQKIGRPLIADPQKLIALGWSPTR